MTNSLCRRSRGANVAVLVKGGAIASADGTGHGPLRAEEDRWFSIPSGELGGGIDFLDG